jgi:hypothetical protein
MMGKERNIHGCGERKGVSQDFAQYGSQGTGTARKRRVIQKEDYCFRFVSISLRFRFSFFPDDDSDLHCLESYRRT